MTGANGAGRGATAVKSAPFDLDSAVAAARAEANAVPFEFSWRGKPYAIPVTADWPVEVLDLVMEGELGKAMRLLLPAPEGWDPDALVDPDDRAKGKVGLAPGSYDQLQADGITVGALNTLIDQVGASAGLESRPNPPSAAPTPRGTTRT